MFMKLGATGRLTWRRTPCFQLFLGKAGADERIRTADLLITNQLLYQLSYVGLEGKR